MTSSTDRTEEATADRLRSLDADELATVDAWWRACNYLTVGQIYRMHFDERSWLWHDRTKETDYPRTCQGNPVEGGPCPPLTLHPPRGWP